MSGDNFENLADASWAADFFDDKDFAELQAKGEHAVAEASCRKVFYLGIYEYVENAKDLVEAYARINNADELEEIDDSDFALMQAFTYKIIGQFYQMCVDYGTLEKDFWKEDK